MVSAVRAARVPPGPSFAPLTGPAPAQHRRDSSPAGPRSAASRAARPARAQPDRVPGRVSTALRDLAGRREPGLSSARFAVTTLTLLGASMDQRVHGITTGTDLLVLAEARDALADEAPLTGDLVLFEPPGDADLLVGIVIAAGDATVGRSGAETAEIIYLADGAVQRGFVTPARPAMATDRQGNPRNSDLCHGADHASGAARCLAGQQFRAYLRLDRLAR